MDPFIRIAETIDGGALRAPKKNGDFSKSFIKYLALLFTQEEAEIVQYLNMPFRLRSYGDIAAAAGKDPSVVRSILASLAEKSYIMGFGDSYCLPMVPLLVNVCQLHEEIRPGDLEAARLYQEFFIKDGFYRYYENSEKGTPIMRVIPVNRTMKGQQEILDTEEAHRIIRSATNLALSLCPCRVRTEKMGVRECRDKYPIGFCIMMEAAAAFYQARGLGRKVTADEAILYFDKMQDMGLVGTMENFDESATKTVICLCCGCCCSQLRGRTRWDNPAAVAPSNFVAESGDGCLLCGACADRCFFGAISMDETAGRAVVDPAKCMGCGVCVLGCPNSVMGLTRVERSKPFSSARDLYGHVASENHGRE